jgi:hypothetical protein
MVAMQKLLSSLVIAAACAAIGACGNSDGNPSFGGDDGGGGSSGSSGSGSSGGGSGGSSGGSGGSSGGSGGSSGGHGSSSGGSSGSSSGGGNCTTPTGPITGMVGANGGSISRLAFAVVGDTRPPNEDDISGYPTSIITKIYQDIESFNPHPPFVLSTGDYMFASTGSGSTASQQVGLYMQARLAYTGTSFPAMGNHECGVGNGCSGSTECNCGPNNSGGATSNYNAFMSQMLAPLSQTKPYYSFNVTATDNSWTAKFVMTAANAWDSGQQSWLQGVMAQKTTYTFIVRHEASDATPPLPSGVAGVDAVIANYPYTLMINGHAHTYYYYWGNPNRVTIGNGGAPLTSKNYGYGMFTRRCDGAIVGDMYDYMTNAADAKFHFVITPDGKETQ